MNLNFTEDAVLSLNHSAGLAAREGEPAVLPKHVFAGVLTQNHPTVAECCSRLRASLDALPEGLLGGEGTATFGDHLPNSSETNRAFDWAVQFAANHEHPAVTSLHLLVGTARIGDPAVSALLAAWSVDPKALEREAERILEPPA